MQRMSGLKTFFFLAVAAAVELARLLGADTGPLEDLQAWLEQHWDDLLILGAIAGAAWARYVARVNLRGRVPLSGGPHAHWAVTLLLLMMLAGGLAGCAGGLLVERDDTGLTQAQVLERNVREGVGAGYISITQARRLNRELLFARRTDSATASYVQTTLDRATEALDTAATLLALGPAKLAQAEDKLGLARQLIASARALLPLEPGNE